MSLGPLRVLVVEHTPADAELCILELERAGYQVDHAVVATPQELQAQLRTRSFDIILADFRLPDWTGLDALRIVQGLGRDIPVILVTGTLGDERAVESLKLGAADYVLKQNLFRLPMAVTRALQERSAREEKSRADDLIRKLTMAVDQSPASVIITDLDARIEYVNRRFIEATGYAAEEVLGRKPSMLQSGETPPQVYKDLWRTLLREEVWRGELLNRTKDGRLVWHAVVISPVRNAGGVVTNYLAVQEDVTERKRAETALLEREGLFRAVIETSFDGLAFTEDGIIREANNGFAAMLGYTLAELIGTPMDPLFAPETREEARHRALENLHGTYDVMGLRKDGKRIRLEATGRPHVFHGRSGRLIAFRDLTEKWMLEAQLRQAQKMDAIGRLAGGVAHDFNNLLTVITSHSEFLLQDLPEGLPSREDVTAVFDAARRAAALTRQLLAFSRQQVIEPRDVTVNEVVGSAEKMLQRLIGEDIVLTTVLDPDSPSIRIDPGQLEQVIMNLAVNSRDAMPDGGGLTLRTGHVDLDGNTGGVEATGRFATLEVADTGAGMDESIRTRVFEPFFTTKDVGKGTGLGLSTVYGIVKQAGGFLQLESEVGKGTTFRIFFPQVVRKAVEEDADALEQSWTGDETILLCEDNPQVRSVARAILARNGYAVLEASTPELAVQVSVQHPGPIHLLLTDVIMPVMNGEELAMRFLAARPEARVVFMSGYTDEMIGQRLGLVRMGGFLQKPFTMDSLSRTVREALDGPAGR